MVRWIGNKSQKITADKAPSFKSAEIQEIGGVSLTLAVQSDTFKKVYINDFSTRHFD